MLPCLLPFEFPPLPPLLTSHYVALIKQLIPLSYLFSCFFMDVTSLGHWQPEKQPRALFNGIPGYCVTTPLRFVPQQGNLVGAVNG